MSVRDRVNEVLALLCARFPKTFFAYQLRRRPLKIGIHHELEAVLGESVERKLLRLTIKVYVLNYGYLQSLRAGAERIDLDGKAAGVVTEGAAEKAEQMLARRREIKKQKRKEQQKRQPKPEKPEPEKARKPEPRRDGLAALREAAARRRQSAGGAA